MRFTERNSARDRLRRKSSSRLFSLRSVFPAIPSSEATTLQQCWQRPTALRTSQQYAGAFITWHLFYFVTDSSAWDFMTLLK